MGEKERKLERSVGDEWRDSHSTAATVTAAGEGVFGPHQRKLFEHELIYAVVIGMAHLDSINSESGGVDLSNNGGLSSAALTQPLHGASADAEMQMEPLDSDLDPGFASPCLSSTEAGVGAGALATLHFVTQEQMQGEGKSVMLGAGIDAGVGPDAHSRVAPSMARPPSPIPSPALLPSLVDVQPPLLDITTRASPSPGPGEAIDWAKSSARGSVPVEMEMETEMDVDVDVDVDAEEAEEVEGEVEVVVDGEEEDGRSEVGSQSSLLDTPQMNMNRVHVRGGGDAGGEREGDGEGEDGGDGGDGEYEYDTNANEEQAAIGRLASMSLMAAVTANGPYMFFRFTKLSILIPIPTIPILIINIIYIYITNYAIIHVIGHLDEGSQRAFVREVERASMDPVYWVRREATFALGALAKVVPEELVYLTLVRVFFS